VKPWYAKAKFLTSGNGDDGSSGELGAISLLASSHFQTHAGISPNPAMLRQIR
jgi:hypothetical protein